MTHLTGDQTDSIEAGKSSQVPVPRDIELWFDVLVLPASAPSTGNVIFGSAVQFDDGIAYPMIGVQAASGQIAGFKIIEHSQLPSKTVGTGLPANGIVSFSGQCSCGMLGIVNNTDAAISVRIRYAPRKIGD